MGVAVDEAGQHQLALQIDDLRVVVDPFLGVRGVAHEDDRVAPHRHCLSHGALAVNGVDHAVLEHQVGLAELVERLAEYLRRLTAGGVDGWVPGGQTGDAGQETVELSLLQVGAVEFVGVVELSRIFGRRVGQRVAGRPHHYADGLLPGQVVVEAEIAVGVTLDDLVGCRHRHVTPGIERVVHGIIGRRGIGERRHVGHRDLVPESEHRHLGELLTL